MGLEGSAPEPSSAWRSWCARQRAQPAWRNCSQGCTSAEPGCSISAALCQEGREKLSLKPSHCTDAILGAGSLKNECVGAHLASLIPCSSALRSAVRGLSSPAGALDRMRTHISFQDKQKGATETAKALWVPQPGGEDGIPAPGHFHALSKSWGVWLRISSFLSSLYPWEAGSPQSQPLLPVSGF